ncbi:polysaccharide biosynthesis/export family protein [Bordetella genomosp. 13]|uniref:Multidrug MFS transporter n=1 Tax=Bordetella genomosp. 13 TaxID=463040 RepID=A0A1W6ZD77_9BORD|nr:polysaccharide biosynthesis/export family protein [Bordetella genomosp. 13]ARP95100.1 multidrug MFS transporter [Bordetella genomosp. 13]
MNIAIRTLYRTGLMVALVSLLGACAFAPGMRYQSGFLVDPADPNSKVEVSQITPTLAMQATRARQVPVSDDVRKLTGKPQPYVIGPGDIISIVVWDHPELVLPTQTYSIGTGPTELSLGDTSAGIPGYPVSSDGYVQFPYVGLLKVAGLTEVQIRNSLLRGLADYIPDPQITVRVLGYRSKRVYVEGEVKTPGPAPITDVPMTLPEAVNRAGGLLPTADRSRVFLTRHGQTTRLDLPALEAAGIDQTSILLQTGDIVRVQARSDNKVYVMGEVTTPAALTMRDGELSLGDALGEAGGPSQLTSNPADIYVVRALPDARPQVFHLDSSSPQALAVAQKFPLESKDVVFVDAGNLVRWNRFISLLFPTTQTVQTVDTTTE